MKPYAQLPTDNPEEYKRLVGLSKEDFQHLNSKLCVYIGPHPSPSGEGDGFHCNLLFLLN
ncbi:hypothetical protein [Methylovulum psychrotolerans]|uniref:hypothetical protein n=1 Tax=Methylovulum psychrotolerans TaxID=1704499 RepID=UPI0012FA2365|nr:hypothetical protein [Methylovulum psychrotolerans]